MTPALCLPAGMDELMEVSFSPLAATGKPLSRCGKCHRFMKYIQVGAGNTNSGKLPHPCRPQLYRWSCRNHVLCPGCHRRMIEHKAALPKNTQCPHVPYNTQPLGHANTRGVFFPNTMPLAITGINVCTEILELPLSARMEQGPETHAPRLAVCHGFCMTGYIFCIMRGVGVEARWWPQ